MRPELCVGGVVLSHGHMLVVKRAHDPQAGLWSLPGGRVEAGETLATALEREVHEETGLRVRCGDFVGFAEIITAHRHNVVLDFTAELTGDPWSCVPSAGSDAAEAQWISLDRLGELQLVDDLLSFLQDHHLIP